MDYSSFGFNSYGFNFTSLSNSFTQTFTAMQRDLQERSPYLNPVSISRGTLLTTGGGLTQMQSATGGTNLFTVDPVTGTVTIAGGVIVNQTLSLGTAVNSTFSGTVTNVGTMSLGAATSGTLSDSLVSGGTTSGNKFTGGTMIFSTLSNGTLESPVINDIPVFEVNTGSNTLITNGAFQLQTYGTGVAIMARLGGTTFRFTPSGTI